jgi:outer membrane protein assembly factor BamA
MDDEGLLDSIARWSPARHRGGTVGDGIFAIDTVGGEKEADGEFLGAPVPFGDPTFGVGLALVGGYIFKLDPEDEVSSPSLVGAGAMASSNGSWGGGVAGDFSIDEDRWRVKASLIYADVNYRIYGVGQDQGKEGDSFRIDQSVLALQFDVLRYLGQGIYLGPVVQAFSVDTLLNEGDPLGDRSFPIPADPDRTRQISLGLQMLFDTRDDKFYPRAGSYLDLQARVFSEYFGGDDEFRVYSAAYNRYLALGPSTVLASRGYGRVAEGDVPFYALSYLGVSPDIRGYSIGRYQDRMLLAFQAELRQEIAGGFGAEVFAGVGQVRPNLGDFTLRDFLPGIGAGVTYTVAKKNQINLRVDAAWGVDGWVFYLGAGQAF